MKNIRLFILLYSVLLIYPTIIKTKTHKHVFIKLEHSALQILDGRTPGMNSNSISDCFKVRNILNTLLCGEKDPETHTFKKKYTLNGQLVALIDCVKIEAAIITQNTNFNSHLKEEFRIVLNAMKQEFFDATRPLLGQTPKIRRETLHLIQEWCAKGNRPHSLLLHWGAVDEEAALRKASAAEFKQFCIDLKDFLYDLIYSSPKGRQSFKEHREHKHSPEYWEEFDAQFKA